MSSTLYQGYLEELKSLLIDQYDEREVGGALENAAGENDDGVVSQPANSAKARLSRAAEDAATVLAAYRLESVVKNYCATIRQVTAGLDEEIRRKMVVFGLVCSLATSECRGGRRAAFYIGDLHKLFEEALSG